MIKIKALNDGTDSSDSSDSEVQVTREAEEEGLKKLYTSALKAASEGNNEGAIELLHELKQELEIDMPKVKDAMILKTLKYLTYKNLGLFKNDLNLILDALDLDDSDFNLWITAGRKGKEKMEFLLARKCFESAYKFNQSNYTVIDNLMDIYYILNDLYSCVNMCLRALEIDQQFTKAITLINQCINLMPPLVKDMKDYMCYVHAQYGGDYLPEKNDDEENVDTSQEIINQLDVIKTKRLRCSEEQGNDDSDGSGRSSKRKNLILDLDRLRLRTCGEIGQKIATLHDQIQRDLLNICTPIELNITNRKVSSIKNGDLDNSAPNGVTYTSGEKASDSNEKASESSQTAKSSNSSLMDFVDKRRSSRVKSIKTAKSRELDDDQSVLENLLELVPENLKIDESSKIDSLDKENSSNSASLPSIEQNPNNRALTAEQESIDRCLDSLERLFQSTRAVNIFELIECFLVELSFVKHITIPPVFMQLYQIFRDQHTLPCAITCKIDIDVTLNMIWTCLTANEIKYNKNETLFLTQVLPLLSEKMSHENYRHFVIRLLVLRGTKEFYNDCLVYALDLCSSTSKYSSIFNVNMETTATETMEVEQPKKHGSDEDDKYPSYAVVASNNLVINDQYINTILKMQTVPLSKPSEKNYTEIIQLFFTKSEADLTFEEKTELCEAIVSAQMWQKGIELFENWSDLNDTCLATIYQCVKSGNRARLSPKIMSKIVKHASESKSPLPWSILYWAFMAEGVDYKEANNSLIKLCTIGHHCLGRKGICTANEGEFLLCSLKVFIEHELEDEVLKCFSCLFNFPSRKSLNSTHTSPHIELKWAHCEDIYFYFEPACMPEFDSHARQSGITQEIKDFFLKILRLIPEDLQPLKQSQNITNYINNGGTLVEPTFANAPPLILSTIYYLLADFHFKTKDFGKAKQFYIFDLTINTKRFDSWAGLALSINYQLEQLLLEHGTRPNAEKYQRTAFNVVQCFEQALRLEENNSKLWIEFGLVSYNISSNMSRMKKMAELFKWTLDESNVLFKYQEILDKAENCFEKAKCSEKDNDELWLSYYMLGKVSEKKREGLLSTLQYYERADLCLYLDGAAYPKKISYYNPPYLSVEALEVHYRIHASILKYLLHNRKFSARMLRQIKLHLISAKRSPFALRKVYTSPASSNFSFQSQKKPNSFKAGSVESSSAPSSQVDPQISELVDDLAAIVGERDQKFDVNRSRGELIRDCIAGLKRCLTRYSGHYKSYYRLADSYNVFNDLSTVKALLLGGSSNKHMESVKLEHDSGKPGSVSFLPGLFIDRKPANFFNGIWRIPVDEIERAGNFNAHMFRCVWMLIRTCIASEDFHTLSLMSIQLFKTPDLDKRYINDMERKELSVMAFNECFIFFREALLKPETNKQRLVSEIEVVAQTFMKSNVYSKETLEACNAINSLLEGK